MSVSHLAVEAVNWCHAPALYQYQLAAAQRRCNQNRTSELVLHIGSEGEILDQRFITVDTDLPVAARNVWR